MTDLVCNVEGCDRETYDGHRRCFRHWYGIGEKGVDRFADMTRTHGADRAGDLPLLSILKENARKTRLPEHEQIGRYNH